jgi:hypothetical protein
MSQCQDRVDARSAWRTVGRWNGATSEAQFVLSKASGASANPQHRGAKLEHIEEAAANNLDPSVATYNVPKFSSGVEHERGSHDT